MMTKDYSSAEYVFSATIKQFAEFFENYPERILNEVKQGKPYLHMLHVDGEHLKSSGLGVHEDHQQILSTLKSNFEEINNITLQCSYAKYEFKGSVVLLAIIPNGYEKDKVKELVQKSLTIPFSYALSSSFGKPNNPSEEYEETRAALTLVQKDFRFADFEEVTFYIY